MISKLFALAYMITPFLNFVAGCKSNSLIDQILSKEIQAFVEEHLQDDPNHLRLKYKMIFDLPANIVVDQISGRKKAKEKLPRWYRSRRIVYPPSLNLEQSSSERTAIQKVNLLKEMMGASASRSRLVDLTGGFGVDTLAFADATNEVHYVEPNNNVLEIARHNHQALGASDIHYYNLTAEAFVDTILSPTMKFDVVYIDPARRSKEGQKIFTLSQCEPDVTKLQDSISPFTEKLLLKTSPLLDIKLGLKELQHVKKVCVVSVHNECKEVLFFCERNFLSEPVIEAINLDDVDSSFSFSFSGEEKSEVEYADPLTYLYEPNASILKAGAFKTVGARFNIYKLHPNTHLYTSHHLIPEFPGRIFQLESFVKSDTKELRNYFEDSKANIFTRNYPLSVDSLRKKTRLKEGGEKFLIGFSGIKKKFLVVASRLDGL